MPIVSIVIPTYNSEKTIRETIISVQQQSFTDWELIIIDDGSQDNTVNLIKSITEPRLKVFIYENGGVSTARNRGIAQATGKYLSFLDADDLWTADKLALQLETLNKHSKAKVVYSWTSYIDEEGQLLYLGPQFSFQNQVFKELLQKNFLLNASNLMICRDVLDIVEGFSPEFSYAADWYFYLRLAKNFEFAVVPQYQILYRQSASSMSSKIEDMKEQCLSMLDLIFEDVPNQLKYLKDISYSNFYLYCADLYLKKIDLYNKENLNNAWKNLHIAIDLHTSNLFKKDTQRILIKLFLWELSFKFSKK